MNNLFEHFIMVKYNLMYGVITKVDDCIQFLGDDNHTILHSKSNYTICDYYNHILSMFFFFTRSLRAGSLELGDNRVRVLSPSSRDPKPSPRADNIPITHIGHFYFYTVDLSRYASTKLP